MSNYAKQRPGVHALKNFVETSIVDSTSGSYKRGNILVHANLVNLMKMVEGNMGEIFWFRISKVESFGAILLNFGYFNGTNPILLFEFDMDLIEVILLPILICLK